MTLKLFFIFFSLFFSLLADNCAIPLATTETGPLGFMQHVNVVTGEFVDHDIDLIVPGAQPVVLSRSFTNFSQWRYQHETYAYIRNDSRKKKYELNCNYYEPGVMGAHLTCRQDYASEIFKVDPGKKECYGLTNMGRGSLSGRSSFKNLQLIRELWKSSDIVLTFGDGSVNTLHPACRKVFAKDEDFDIIKHREPNGSTTYYNRDLKNCLLTSIQSKNPSDTLCYGTIECTQEQKNGSKIQIFQAKGDGRKIKCSYGYSSDFCYPPALLKVERENAPNIEYRYLPSPVDYYKRCLTKIIRPENRVTEVEYWDADSTKEQIGKVRYLKKAISNNESVITHQFSYTAQRNVLRKTEVANSSNESLYDYYLDTFDRVHFIDRYFDKNRLSRQALYWDNFGTDHGNLIKEEIFEGQGTEAGSAPLLTKEYVYDVKGNVEKQITTSGSESIEKKSHYSTDGFNMPLEVIEGQIKIIYRYKKGCLVTAKLVCDASSGHIYRREFYDYDDTHAVQTLVIVDDGNGEDTNDLQNVTERHITRFTLKANAPCLGLPEVVWEGYWDPTTREEKQLRRTVNHYTSEGWIDKQEVYDSNDTFVYELITSFNRFGLPEEQIDALGQKTIRKFDANGNMIYEERGTLIKKMVYDCANRMEKRTEIEQRDEGSKNPVIREYFFTYDLYDQKLSETDPSGATTFYKYDLAGRLIESKLPLGRGAIYITYDALDRIVSEKDAEGRVKKISYGIHNKPTHIQYPNEISEAFSYDKNGYLVKAIDKGQTTTLYENDCLGREIARHVVNSEGIAIQSSYKRYTGFQLIEEIAPEGTVTCYHYDGAGRIVEVTCGERRTTYSYDSLGRVYETRQWIDDVTYRSKRIFFDLLDRPIEEQLLDEAGNIFTTTRYCYDFSGNCTHVMIGESVSETVFDSWNRPVKLIDALGHTTYIHYVEGNGQLTRTTSDPMDVQHIEVIDALGHIIISEKWSPSGQLLESNKFAYDLVGNCLKADRQILEDGNINRQTVTEWVYDENNQAILLTEGSGTDHLRITHTKYNKFGEKERITKPDGVEIVYTYNLLHLVETLDSIGAAYPVSYQYHYNPSGLITEVNDKIQQTTTRRTYDDFHQLTSETLANGLKVCFTYDNLGRILSIFYPDGTAVSYRYDSVYLREVRRITPQKTYSHHYLDYSEYGDITRTKFVNATEASYSYNLLRQITVSSLPHFLQKDVQYDPNGNRLKRCINGKEESYSYDCLNQLTKEPSYAYDYDSIGNRLKKNEQKFTYDALNQTNGIEYDDCGNQKTGNQCNLIYDALDRLVEVQTPFATHHYTYDAFHRRLTADEKQFLYQENCEVGCYENRILTQFRTLGLGKGAEIGASILFELQSKTYIPLHNDSGSIIALLDLSGKLIEQYDDSLFGEGSKTGISPWRFLSKRQDPETGYIYFGRRFYSPTQGRWLSTDPKSYDEGPNLYLYARNNPLRNIDLYGLEAYFDDDLYYDYSYPAYENPLYRGIFDLFSSDFNDFRYEFSYELNTLCDFFGVHDLSLGNSYQENTFINNYESPLYDNEFSQSAYDWGRNIGSVFTHAALFFVPCGGAAKVEAGISKGIQLVQRSTAYFTLNEISRAESVIKSTETWGWRVGDPINNLTNDGRIAQWNTVRSRIWKNEAHLRPEKYSDVNLVRMQKGLAPQRVHEVTGKLESKELHHSPAQRDGGLFNVQPLWPEEHASIDLQRKLKRK